MKKALITFLIAAFLALGGTAFAETTATEAPAKNYAPEPGSGWMTVEINGEPVELTYKSCTPGLSGTVYTFESEEYTISIMFNNKLEVGVSMAENAVQQIEIISNNAATSGYYFTKKSSVASVDSEVTLAQKTEDGLMQGTFRVTVTPGDRWVGDVRPGIVPELPLDNGEFCFCK